MKKASKFLKQLFSAIVAAVKERSAAMRTRTSAARTRLIIFGILRNRKLLMSAINSKIHAIIGGAHDAGIFNAGNHRAGGGDEGRAGGTGEHGDGGGHILAGGGGGGRRAAVLQSLPSFSVEQEKRAVVLLSSLPSFNMDRDVAGGDDDYGEQQHDALARSSTAGGEGGKEHDGEAGFRLEDEIDRAADVFITRFYNQMKLQKLESFKRFCEMLERN